MAGGHTQAGEAEGAGARAFLGWRVVAGAFSVQLVSHAVAFNAFGAFVLPIAEAFDTTRGVVTSGIGILLVTQGLLGPFLGRAMDHGPIRVIMTAGIVSLCIGLLCISYSTALLQAALALGLFVAVGAAMTGPLATIPLVAKWFVRRRGLVLGLTVSGATVASMAGPALAAFLIETEGWRHALRILAAGAVCIALPLVWWLVVRSPEDVGQRPDGDPAAPGAPEPTTRPLPVATLLRDPNFFLVSFAFAFLFAMPIVVSVHLLPFANDLGIDALRASAFFSVMAPCSILGKIVFGVAVDRIDTRHAVLIAIALLAASCGVLLTGPSYPVLLANGVVFGLGVGAVGPMQGVVVAACFGRSAVGQVMGLGGLMGVPIVAGAAPLVGLLFDAQGSYDLGFQLQLAALGVSAVCFGLLRIPDVEPGTQRPAEPAVVPTSQNVFDTGE